MSERSEDRQVVEGTRSVTVTAIWRFFSCVEEERTSVGAGLRAGTSAARQPEEPASDDERTRRAPSEGSVADRGRCSRGTQADR